MDISEQFLSSIAATPAGLSLAELLAKHPDIARRTAQRVIRQMIEAGEIEATGEGRARRYFPGIADAENDSTLLPQFPANIPISEDSKDIVAYIELPIAARKPVGYQPDLLEDYEPNQSWYLSESLRRQLHKIGSTHREGELAGTYSRDILNRLLIDLSWASSHLEGNTYSLLDTRELIEHGRSAKGKKAKETQMVLNHKTAIEFLVENIESIGFNRYTLMNLHSALAENLLANPADEGRIRQQAVDVAGSTYRPLSVPQQIEGWFDVLLLKANEISDPFEQSFFVMLHLPYLQPFIDINKRTSRLIANLPLFKCNLCPLTFLDMPKEAYNRAILGVYELGRIELLRDLYVWAYERSAQEYMAITQELAEPDPLRLLWRKMIKQTILAVITNPQQKPLDIIDEHVIAEIPESERDEMRSLIVDELKRLHEGVLARYGLRPSEYDKWKSVRGMK